MERVDGRKSQPLGALRQSLSSRMFREVMEDRPQGPLHLVGIARGRAADGEA